MSHKKDEAVELQRRNMINGVSASCPHAALHARSPTSPAPQYAWKGTIRSDVWRWVIRFGLTKTLSDAPPMAPDCNRDATGAIAAAKVRPGGHTLQDLYLPARYLVTLILLPFLSYMRMCAHSVPSKGIEILTACCPVPSSKKKMSPTYFLSLAGNWWM
jgi:hypothetical protein